MVVSVHRLQDEPAFWTLLAHFVLSEPFAPSFRYFCKRRVEDCRRQHLTTLVAVDDDTSEIVGYAHLDRDGDGALATTWLGLYVIATHRRRGLGKQLVERLLSDARTKHQLRAVHLTVDLANTAAQLLYARHGFCIAEDYKPTRNEIQMVCCL